MTATMVPPARPKGGRRPRPRPFPIEDLAQAIADDTGRPQHGTTRGSCDWCKLGFCCNWNFIARYLGVHVRQVHRWKASGLTVDQADDLAMTAGLHPFEVWGEAWWSA